MRDEERDEFGTCSACGMVIESTAECSYSFGAGQDLCRDCALARGGQYRADRDVWDPPPNLRGLQDED